MDAWNWYVSENDKNLWECAKENGYISSSVEFPVSVGAKSDYHIPKIWIDGSHLDTKLIDALVGELVEKAHEMTNNNVVVCVVSDHVTIDNKYDIKSNIIFVQNNLIEIDTNGKLINWDVWCQRSGGAGQIRLRDKENQEKNLK